MLLRHSLDRLDIAEHPVLLLIVSSHAATTNTSRCGLGVIFQQPARSDCASFNAIATWTLGRRLLIQVFKTDDTPQPARTTAANSAKWIHNLEVCHGPRVLTVV